MYGWWPRQVHLGLVPLDALRHPLVTPVRDLYTKGYLNLTPAPPLANGYCYFDNPTPSGGNYRVIAGSTNTIVYPYVDNGIDTQWNGNYGFCEEGKLDLSSKALA